MPVFNLTMTVECPSEIALLLSDRFDTEADCLVDNFTDTIVSEVK